MVQQCHKAHHIDQRNVLSAKMYVVGTMNHFLFQGSKAVKMSQNWPAEFCHCHFVRGGGGGLQVGGTPPRTHYIHPYKVVVLVHSCGTGIYCMQGSMQIT